MDEKIEIAHKLDELGIPQIEAGFPIVSENEKKMEHVVASAVPEYLILFYSVGFGCFKTE